MKEILSPVSKEYLRVIKDDFKKYKSLGDKTFVQLKDEDFHLRSDEDNNSIAIIIQHLSGNLRSRFVNFLAADGEKPSRDRDAEFEEQNLSRNDLLQEWDSGWEAAFAALNSLKPEDLNKTVMIRNEPHSVIEALNRLVTHCAYHVGQIVLVAKQIKKSDWKSLSIPKKA